MELGYINRAFPAITPVKPLIALLVLTHFDLVLVSQCLIFNPLNKLTKHLTDMDPCVRKTTMPAPPVSGKKRSLESEREEVSSATKILKTLLESDRDIVDSPSVSENVNIFSDFEISDNETDPVRPLELPICANDVDVVKQQVEEDEVTVEISDEESKQEEITNTHATKLLQKKFFKSREFVEDDSDSNQEVPRKAILVDAIPIKSQIVKSKLVSERGLLQCSYILVRGDRKGERCTNKQKTPFCGLHDKEKKDTSVSKQRLIQLLDETKKENQVMRQELLVLKKLKNDIESCNKNKEEKSKETEQIKKHIFQMRKTIFTMRQDKANQEQKMKEINEEKIVLRNKLSELEAKLNNLNTQEDCRSPKSRGPTKPPRRKLSKLNKTLEYKLIKYCSVPRSTAKEAIFECADGRFKVDLPQKFDKKEENENLVVKYSVEDKRFMWFNLE